MLRTLVSVVCMLTASIWLAWCIKLDAKVGKSFLDGLHKQRHKLEA